MKVIIAITAEQATRLENVIKLYNESVAGYSDNYRAGDVDIINHSFGFNDNQSLKQDGMRVEIEGHRCALRSDGIMELLGRAICPEANRALDAVTTSDEEKYTNRKKAWELINEEFSKLQVIVYQTSDKRLEWWQCLSDIAGEFTEQQLVELTGEELGYNAFNYNIIVRRIRDLVVALKNGTTNRSKVSAELNKVELTIFDRMVKHSNEYYGTSM